VIWRLVFSWRKRVRITRLAAEVERHAEVEPHAEGQMTHEQPAFESYFQGSLPVRALPVVVVGFSFSVDRLYNGDDGSVVWLLVGGLSWAWRRPCS
jgi:hypothetical protein